MEDSRDQRFECHSEHSKISGLSKQSQLCKEFEANQKAYTELAEKHDKLMASAKFVVEEFQNGYGSGHSKFCECGMCELGKLVEG
jgi:hypothetical protein